MTEELTNTEPLEVQRLTLKDGDTLVLRFPGKLTLEQVDSIRAQLEAAVPGHRALILDDGARLEVLEEEEVSDAAGV